MATMTLLGAGNARSNESGSNLPAVSGSRFYMGTPPDSAWAKQNIDSITDNVAEVADPSGGTSAAKVVTKEDAAGWFSVAMTATTSASVVNQAVFYVNGQGGSANAHYLAMGWIDDPSTAPGWLLLDCTDTSAAGAVWSGSSPTGPVLVVNAADFGDGLSFSFQVVALGNHWFRVAVSRITGSGSPTYWIGPTKTSSGDINSGTQLPGFFLDTHEAITFYAAATGP